MKPTIIDLAATTGIDYDCIADKILQDTGLERVDGTKRPQMLFTKASTPAAPCFDGFWYNSVRSGIGSALPTTHLSLGAEAMLYGQAISDLQVMDFGLEYINAARDAMGSDVITSQQKYASARDKLRELYLDCMMVHVLRRLGVTVKLEQ